tara:strand:- start:28836 stop:29087 length:252 start_codon:yes stop_codon:yes gene_type:complete
MSFFYSLLLSVLLWITSDAAPLIAEKRGIQTNQLTSFKLMREYASAAYCASIFGSPGDQITCAAGNCPQVEAADSATVVEYDR